MTAARSGGARDARGPAPVVIIHCDNQGHIDDLEWPAAEWVYARDHQPTRYVCNTCKQLSTLLAPSVRRHFERLPVGRAGTPSTTDEGNQP